MDDDGAFSEDGRSRSSRLEDDDGWGSKGEPEKGALGIDAGLSNNANGSTGASESISAERGVDGGVSTFGACGANGGNEGSPAPVDGGGVMPKGEASGLGLCIEV